jgi:hypothetical protein
MHTRVALNTRKKGNLDARDDGFQILELLHIFLINYEPSIASNGRMVDKLENIWKEKVVV